MKFVVPVVLLSSVLFFSCKKNTSKVCHDPITQVPAFLSLSGPFTQAEVDTVILKRYYKGSAQLITSDTVFSKGFSFRGDTCVANTGTTGHGYFSFGSLKKGEDYELLVPGASRIYRITDVKYNDSSTVVNYVTSGECGARAYDMPPDSARINNRATRTMPGDEGTSYIFLQK
jgi:hypothetical protein